MYGTKNSVLTRVPQGRPEFHGFKDSSEVVTVLEKTHSTTKNTVALLYGGLLVGF